MRRSLVGPTAALEGIVTSVPMSIAGEESKEGAPAERGGDMGQRLTEGESSNGYEPTVAEQVHGDVAEAIPLYPTLSWSAR